MPNNSRYPQRDATWRTGGPSVHAAGDGLEGAYSAKLHTAPSGGTCKVIIPALSLTDSYPASCSQAFTGSVGDMVLVMFDENKEPWVISPSGVIPSGAAGGDLSGTYPNPSVQKIDAVAVPYGKVSRSVGMQSLPATDSVFRPVQWDYAPVQLGGGMAMITTPYAGLQVPTTGVYRLVASVMMSSDASGATPRADMRFVNITTSAYTYKRFLGVLLNGNFTTLQLSEQVPLNAGEAVTAAVLNYDTVARNIYGYGSWCVMEVEWVGAQ